MSRYDKYDPKNGGYRAPLAADFLPANLERLLGVGHDAEGRVVLGAGATGITGVLVLTKARKAGEIVDVMTSGEVVEFGPTEEDPGVDFGTAGTVYYADSDGNVAATPAPSGEPPAVDLTGLVRVGHTVKGQRLIVRVEH